MNNVLEYFDDGIDDILLCPISCVVGCIGKRIMILKYDE